MSLNYVCSFRTIEKLFSIPKLQYILRTSLTFLCKDELVHFDEKVRNGLQAILNVDLLDGAWTQASLIIGAAEMDLRKRKDLFVPAFISSSHST